MQNTFTVYWSILPVTTLLITITFLYFGLKHHSRKYKIISVAITIFMLVIAYYLTAIASAVIVGTVLGLLIGTSISVETAAIISALVAFIIIMGLIFLLIYLSYHAVNKYWTQPSIKR